MDRQLTRGSRLLAGVIAMALASVPTATCLAAVTQMTETSHHACSDGMRQAGGSANSTALEKDCCFVHSAELARLTTAQAVAASAPVLGTPIVVEPPPTYHSPGAALDPGVPKPSSSPTYLLVSVFRL